MTDDQTLTVSLVFEAPAKAITEAHATSEARILEAKLNHQIALAFHGKPVTASVAICSKPTTLASAANTAIAKASAAQLVAPHVDPSKALRRGSELLRIAHSFEDALQILNRGEANNRKQLTSIAGELFVNFMLVLANLRIDPSDAAAQGAQNFAYTDLETNPPTEQEASND